MRAFGNVFLRESLRIKNLEWDSFVLDFGNVRTTQVTGVEQSDALVFAKY